MAGHVTSPTTGDLEWEVYPEEILALPLNVVKCNILEVHLEHPEEVYNVNSAFTLGPEGMKVNSEWIPDKQHELLRRCMYVGCIFKSGEAGTKSRY